MVRRHRAALIVWCCQRSTDPDQVAAAAVRAIGTATAELRGKEFPDDHDQAQLRLQEIAATALPVMDAAQPPVSDAPEARAAGHVSLTPESAKEILERDVVPRLSPVEEAAYRRVYASDDLDTAAGEPEGRVMQLRRALYDGFAAGNETGDEEASEHGEWRPALLQFLLIPELWAEARRALATNDERRRRPVPVGRTCGARAITALLAPLLILGILFAVGPTSTIAGRPSAAPGGVAHGSISASVAHTRALLGDPQTPSRGRRVTTDIAITIEPAAFRPGDTVTVTVEFTFGFPIVDYRADGSVRCGELDFGSDGGRFEVAIGGELPGLPAQLGPDQVQLGLYPLAGQQRDATPTGAPIVLVGKQTNTAPNSESTSPDKCTQTDVNGYTGTFTIPADSKLTPGGYLSTPTAVAFHGITGDGGVVLTPEDVDGRIAAQLPVVTVLG